jgi:hypothetical protein
VKALANSPISILLTKSGEVTKYLRTNDVHFLQSFWTLQENVFFVHVDTALRTRRPDVNVVLTINTLPIALPRVGGGEVVFGPGLPMQVTFLFNK